MDFAMVQNPKSRQIAGFFLLVFTLCPVRFTQQDPFLTVN
jgi:hypothetical protein